MLRALRRLTLLALGPAVCAVGLLAPQPAAAGQGRLVNGAFSLPDAGTGYLSRPPTGWSGSVDLLSGTVSEHPDGYQAVDLNQGAKGYLKQNLRGVDKGDTVTVVWDDSPNPYGHSVTTAQKYQVRGEGGEAKTFTTLAPANAGNDWQFGRASYTFTADRQDPVLTYTSMEDGALGAVVAHLRMTTAGPAQSADPCAGGPGRPDSAKPPACAALAGNQKKIEDCDEGSSGCLGRVATDGANTVADQGAVQQNVAAAFNKKRQTSPRDATALACALTEPLVAPPGPDQYVFDPQTLNCRDSAALSADDGQRPAVVPGGVLSTLPKSTPRATPPPASRATRP